MKRRKGDDRINTYHEVYSRPEFYWHKEPNDLCKQTIELAAQEDKQTALSVIDLGCGEGRDLIFFARHGYHATGVDISAPGLGKARRWAKDEGLSIRTIQADLSTFRLGSLYDIIYSSGSLTFIPPGCRQEAFDDFKAHTNPGGYNVFNVFVQKPFIATPPDWGSEEHFYRSGDLLAYYWDWEILCFSEIIFDCNSAGVPHRHAMDSMVALKPK